MDENMDLNSYPYRVLFSIMICVILITNTTAELKP